MAFPALIAALAAPVIGGAMSLAGGALSMTGGLVHAASTATGMAWDMGKGVASAAGGMLGGGKSGNVEEEETKAPDPLGKKALPPGTKLNKNGVLIYDKGSKKGGQVLPGQFGDDGKLLDLDERLEKIGPIDRSDASPIQQILDHVKHISANTDRMAVGLGLMAAQSATSKRDEGLAGAETGNKKQGRIAAGISKGWSKVKDSLSNVGKGLKMAMKALMLGGIFVLYKKFKPQIVEFMTATFEWIDGWITKLKESKDPWKEIWDGIKSWGEKMISGMFTYINKTVRDFADNILWGDKGAAAVAAESSALTSSTASLASLSADHGNLGFMTSSGETVDAKDNILSGETRGEVNKAAKKKWASMYNVSRKSDWAIQWTDVPFMHAGLLNWDVLESNPNVPLTIGEKVLISSIMNSKPIVGGDIMELADLTDPKLLNKKLGISEGMSKENRTGILENASK